MRQRPIGLKTGILNKAFPYSPCQDEVLELFDKKHPETGFQHIHPHPTLRRTGLLIGCGFSQH